MTGVDELKERGLNAPVCSSLFQCHGQLSWLLQRQKQPWRVALELCCSACQRHGGIMWEGRALNSLSIDAARQQQQQQQQP
jgi:hypothetical protein